MFRVIFMDLKIIKSILVNHDLASYLYFKKTGGVLTVSLHLCFVCRLVDKKNIYLHCSHYRNKINKHVLGNRMAVTCTGLINITMNFFMHPKIWRPRW